MIPKIFYIFAYACMAYLLFKLIEFLTIPEYRPKFKSYDNKNYKKERIRL